ncbi:anti-sigma F factor [[Clostridium] asparagiforme DSM 15981]|uniref:Anti-sigma F factor n=2 Tax=Enterocloster asparagiformis TaxID=333367 RepID=C0D141_9FIRM|nr:anti-sigma F factor [[Clostridium] asparagiforme DSM 15981]
MDRRKEKMEDKRMETKKEHLRLELDSLSQNEEFARVVTAVFMSRLNPTLEEIDDVKTAVSEAVTNAVIHGYKGEAGTIYMDITAQSGEETSLTVCVRDAGVGIPNVKQAMEPMYTTDTSGERSGMGFSFMEAFMDQVQVESEPGRGTLVTMKKFIGR